MATQGTALITGASSGIGKSFAERCASLGCGLVLVARNEGNLRRVGNDLSTKYGVRCRIVPVDLSDEDQVDSLVRNVEQEVDILYLINNAGFAVPEPFAVSDIERQLDMVRVHVTVVTRLTRAVLKNMLDRRAGYVINVSSTLAFAAFPGNSVYCASKAYINSFTRTLHHEYSGRGVVFQALNPGPTRTNFHKTEAFRHIEKSDDESFTMSPERVVDISFRKLGKQVIVVPGLLNRLLVRFDGLFTRILIAMASSCPAHSPRGTGTKLNIL